jgi:hypothetical protein
MHGSTTLNAQISPLSIRSRWAISLANASLDSEELRKYSTGLPAALATSSQLVLTFLVIEAAQAPKSFSMMFRKLM